MNALNVAYDVEETRPAWKRYPLSILYTIGLVAVVIAAAAFRLIGPWAAQRFANQLGLTTAVATLWTWLHWPVVVLLLLLTVALIYYLGPNIDQPFRYVTPGSVSAVVVWIVASLGFSAYVENFGNYGATYGSLGGMVVLLLYLLRLVDGAAARRGDQRRDPPGPWTPLGKRHPRAVKWNLAPDSHIANRVEPAAGAGEDSNGCKGDERQARGKGSGKHSKTPTSSALAREPRRRLPAARVRDCSRPRLAWSERTPSVPHCQDPAWHHRFVSP